MEKHPSISTCLGSMTEIRARRVFILLEDKPDTQVSESHAEGLKKNAGEWDVDNLYHYSY